MNQLDILDNVEDVLRDLISSIRLYQQQNRTAPFGFIKIGGAKPKRSYQQMLEITITNEQKVNVALVPVTATGKPARLDGAPTWVVQTGDATVAPAADGLSCDLISGDNPGDSVILVSADADLGAGVETIADTIKLTVEGAKASSLGLTASAPVAK